MPGRLKPKSTSGRAAAKRRHRPQEAAMTELHVIPDEGTT
jgi:hypothetical protein